MNVEIEAKWTGIDPGALRNKLQAVGAVLVQSETLMRRKVYDEPTPFAVYGHGWIRVRDEGNKVTLTYKKLKDRTVNGTVDITVIVDSYDKTCALLEEMTLPFKSYQETKRETWKLGETEITIDTWPWIPTFVEIESLNETDLWSVAERLGLDKKLAMHGSVETVYQQHYDVTEDEIDQWPEITFVPIPDWLEKKRLQ